MTGSSPARSSARAVAMPPMPPPITSARIALPRRRRGPAASAPHVPRDLEHALELAPLLVLGDQVAGDARGEPALRAQREPLRRHVARGLLDAALDVIGALEGAGLRRQQAEDDDGV